MNHPVRILILALLSTTGAAPAHADGHRSTATDPTWKTECGSSHLAFPPGMLPASS